MNWTSFIELIQKNAHSTFFFSNTHQIDLIGKTISALCNSYNGHIIIGYDKINVHLTGFDQSDPWIDDYIDQYFPQPSINCEFLFRSNKKVLILNIEKSSLPISFKDHYYRIEESKLVLFSPSPTSIPQNPVPLSDNTSSFSISKSETIYNPKKTTETVEKTKLTSINTTEMGTEPKKTIQSTPVIKEKKDIQENKQITLNKRQNKALNHIKKNGSIKNKMYRKLYAVSHKTAHLELVNMVSNNLIVSSGSGRSTCYRLKDEESIPQISSVNAGMSQLKLELVQSYLEEHDLITEQLYADQFNINLAQAIEEIELLCKMNIIVQSFKNSQSVYIKATEYENN